MAECPSGSVHARVRRLQAIDRSRPASIARIVQRRAAIQNCCLCPVQQNFWVDPPVERDAKGRSHHRQHPSIAGSRAGSSILVTAPLLRAAVTTL
jgi:hypothetical protein